jgi:hypothetical protein
MEGGEGMSWIPFHFRRAGRVIGCGMSVARPADHGNDIRVNVRRLAAARQALSRGRVRDERSEFLFLITLAFMAVYLLIGTPRVLFITT